MQMFKGRMWRQQKYFYSHIFTTEIILNCLVCDGVRVLVLETYNMMFKVHVSRNILSHKKKPPLWSASGHTQRVENKSKNHVKQVSGFLFKKNVGSQTILSAQNEEAAQNPAKANPTNPSLLLRSESGVREFPVEPSKPPIVFSLFPSIPNSQWTCAPDVTLL